MQKKRHLPSLSIGLVLLCMAPAASAIGWARAQQSAVLGQPLDFNAVLRLDPGDTVAAACVAAQVLVGDQRLPPGSVHVVVDDSQADALRMRVLSDAAIVEPVVTVTLTIGCPPHMARRFVLLADPPSLAPPAALPSVAALVDAAEGRALAAAGRPGAAAASAVIAPAPVAAVAPQQPSTQQPSPPQPLAQRPARRPSAARPATTPVRKAAVHAPPAAGHHARLQLDAAEPLRPAAPAASAVDDAIQAVALAASAARAAASAASSAEQRVAALERNVAELRAESKVNQAVMAQMRDRMIAAERSNRWLWPLLLALGALLALVLWLAWRLRVLQGERQAAWRRAAAAEAAPRPATPTSQLPMVTSELQLPAPVAAPQRPAPWSAPPPRPAPPPAVRADAGPDTEPGSRPPGQPAGAHDRTQVLPPQPQVDGDGSPRDVSIEELLDLEQQAEFFIVLGQDDAAIDLLVDHLRNTGGGSPLPYLKLLEIYRRRNDREAYERTRTRFNHRFNAYAPDWDADLQHGRALEDYPGVLPRLQQVWPRPLDAMAELEALLFRKSRGELFELPAYREVLFLYSLARDLLDREAADTGSVDLLLPLADGGEFSATSPHPYFGTERDSVFDARIEDRPTSPIDLDLTQPDTAPVILDPPRRGPV